MTNIPNENMSLFDSFEDLKDVLAFYSTIVENTTNEERDHLFAFLKEAVTRIDPEFTFDHDSPHTAYEIFLIVEKLNISNDMVPFDSPEGYYDSTMEFTMWDPLNPVDDTDQYPDTDCTIEKKSHEVCDNNLTKM